MIDRIGFLFPGQGAQEIGMGKDLCEAFPAAAKCFDAANQILNYDLKKICFEGPEDKLTQTLYAQPAIFTTSMAALAVFKEKFPAVKPQFSAGLSLGEFSALVGSSALRFEDGLRLVHLRAQAMEEAARNRPGTMASVIGLKKEECQQLAAECGCQVANLNSPDQTVLSGTFEAIDKVCKVAESRGAGRVIPLKVGGAFHSELMAEAREKLEAALRTTPIQTPVCTFVPNVKAEAASDPEEIRALLSRQLTSPVRWVETMEKAADEKISVFLEIGPGKILKGLARKCQPGLQVHPMGTMRDLEKLEQTVLIAK